MGIFIVKKDKQVVRDYDRISRRCEKFACAQFPQGFGRSFFHSAGEVAHTGFKVALGRATEVGGCEGYEERDAAAFTEGAGRRRGVCGFALG